MDEKEREQKTETVQAGNGKEEEQEYEKICYICHRPESKAGNMILMPGNMCLCHDCMQKAFDSVMEAEWISLKWIFPVCPECLL